jgi:hypothetical protein
MAWKAIIRPLVEVRDRRVYREHERTRRRGAVQRRGRYEKVL